MFKKSSLSCVYHPEQTITNFCRCKECLLPVCSSCVPLHADEHKIKGTIPCFQDIEQVINSIEKEYASLGEIITSLREALQQIERNKRSNEKQLRQALLKHRNQLVQSFEQALMELQSKLLSQIVEDDNHFIERLQSIDAHINNLSSSLSQDKLLLSSDNVLRQVIFYFNSGKETEIKKELTKMRSNAEILGRDSAMVTVNEGELEAVKRSISRYLTMEVRSGLSRSRPLFDI